MKNFCHLLTCLLLVSMGSVAQVQKKAVYEINGSIKGLNNEKVYLLVRPSDEGIKYDTLVTKGIGDKFKFAGTIQKLRFVELYIGDIRSRKNAYFYLEPGKIQIKGNIDSLSYLSVKGTKTNNELTENQLYLAPIYERRSTLYQKLRNLDENSTEASALTKEAELKADSINAYKTRFMQTHPASDISLGYLYVLQNDLSNDVIERTYNNFSPVLKNSQTGKQIYTKLQASKTVAVGQKAPDFSSSDTSGVKVKLSDFKGKYVLLEFWAHWCVPCRAQHPHLKELYQKFKDKGFTIVQYSVDLKKDERKWKDAIKQDGLTWTQLSDLSKGLSPVAELYGVQPIPDSFLISPDGTILGRRLSPKELDETLSKLVR
ncbi:TlpA disulfide reductase family protein [Pedobacter sp. GR22-6]|uniref:TlpA disulfide reductase family protein n=1 Tax=Pedobacter sp. GR22-6 TaxID=3127957 RepID=UPI00307F37BA